MSINTIGSLFSGIGGLELGLERALGARTIWQVESNEYARRVLAKHWPDARRYNDVREVGRHNLDAPDLICGGFPCQDISIAGKQAGINGERSGLWYEFARIIRELRPRYVILENVSALRIRGLDRVLGDLAESGYGCRWDCIPASAVGAPHQRDRIFIVATLADTPRMHGDECQNYAGGIGQGATPTAESGDGGGPADMADTEVPGLQARTGDGVGACPAQELRLAAHGGSPQGQGAGDLLMADPDINRSEQGRHDAGVGGQPELGQDGRSRVSAWSPQPGMGRVAHGVPPRVDGGIAVEPWERGVPRTIEGCPHRVDRLRCLGNAVVPQVAELVGRLVLEWMTPAPQSENRADARTADRRASRPGQS